MKHSTHNYTITYDTKSRTNVITQKHGSVWVKVMPYCIGNVSMMLFLSLFGADPEESLFQKEGLAFITSVVAFLVVNRVGTCLSRYNEARNYLEQMYRSTRQIIQNMIVFSSSADSNEAKEWRMELTYRMFITLRAAMGVIDYDTDNVNVWDLPEINGEELDEILRLKKESQKYAKQNHTNFEENLCVPFRLAFLVKKTIQSQHDRMKKDDGTSPVIAEARCNKLIDNVDSFLSGYSGIRKFLTTPTPFPFVQMAVTLNSIYVFAIPFVMLSVTGGILSHCFFVFLITYGFFGLEFIATALEDPFGDDPNDFNNLAMAYAAMEDAYVNILQIDGPEQADKLLQRMKQSKQD